MVVLPILIQNRNLFGFTVDVNADTGVHRLAIHIVGETTKLGWYTVFSGTAPAARLCESLLDCGWSLHPILARTLDWAAYPYLRDRRVRGSDANSNRWVREHSLGSVILFNQMRGLGRSESSDNDFAEVEQTDAARIIDVIVFVDEFPVVFGDGGFQGHLIFRMDRRLASHSLRGEQQRKE